MVTEICCLNYFSQFHNITGQGAITVSKPQTTRCLKTIWKQMLTYCLEPMHGQSGDNAKDNETGLSLPIIAKKLLKLKYLDGKADRTDRVQLLCQNLKEREALELNRNRRSHIDWNLCMDNPVTLPSSRNWEYCATL